VNDLEFFQAVFKKAPQVLKYLYLIRHSLIRLSYYPLAQPSIRIVAELKEDFNPKLYLAILLDLTDAITFFGRKSFYAKKPESDLRVVKDPSLEKDKKKKFR
jgi:hypothetical protein